MKLVLVVLSILSFAQFSLAQAEVPADSSQKSSGILQDFDSLGGNKVLLERAQVMTPDQRVSIVQNRIVDRHLRFEVAPELSMNLGGDAYVNSRAYGLNTQFHINPRWSLGLKYLYYNNSLSKEGQSLIDNTSLTGQAIVPDIDYPKGETMALVNWYPFYGKINFLDMGVVHFDIYGLLGAGQVALKSGTTTAYTTGGGIGFWISQHLTARAELRYETYKVQRLQQKDQLDVTTAGVQLGYLF